MKRRDKRTLEGAEVCLRPIARRDINAAYLGWLHDKDVTKYLEVRFNRPDMKELVDFYKKITKSKTNKMFSIIAKGTGERIGNIKLGGINYDHKYADLGIMIGNKHYWGQGLGREACELLLKYAFQALKLEKVVLGVYGDHKAAIRAYAKIGFKEEGRIKDLYRLESGRTDKVVMSISRKEFRVR